MKLEERIADIAPEYREAKVTKQDKLKRIENDSIFGYYVHDVLNWYWSHVQAYHYIWRGFFN